MISPTDIKKEDSNEKKETNKEQQTQLKAEVLVVASSDVKTIDVWNKEQ